MNLGTTRTKFESALESSCVVVAAASAGDGEWRHYEGFHGSVRGELVPCPRILSADLNGPRQRKKGSSESAAGSSSRACAGGEVGLAFVIDHGAEGEY